MWDGEMGLKFKDGKGLKKDPNKSVSQRTFSMCVTIYSEILEEKYTHRYSTLTKYDDMASLMVNGWFYFRLFPNATYSK